MATLGENVHRIRKEQKLTQKELAKAAGMAQSTISAIERDEQNTSAHNIKQLAGALNCSPNALLNEVARPRMKDESSPEYDPYWIPEELMATLHKLTSQDLRRVQDFATGLLAAREPETSDFAS